MPQGFVVPFTFSIKQHPKTPIRGVPKDNIVPGTFNNRLSYNKELVSRQKIRL